MHSLIFGKGLVPPKETASLFVDTFKFFQSTVNDDTFTREAAKVLRLMKEFAKRVSLKAYLYLDSA